MRRRCGQNGTIVIQSGWYRVRWRVDVAGQPERINMTKKIAPVMFDRKGNPKPASPEIRRKAKEIVEQSGANSECRFNEVVVGDVTFQEQAEIYLKTAVSRKRNPVRDTVSIDAAFNKWAYPAIGNLPLNQVDNLTLRPLIEKMAESLSARTTNKYVEYIKQVVKSLKAPNGELVHKRTWTLKRWICQSWNTRNKSGRLSRQQRFRISSPGVTDKNERYTLCSVRPG